MAACPVCDSDVPTTTKPGDRTLRYSEHKVPGFEHACPESGDVVPSNRGGNG